MRKVKSRSNHMTRHLAWLLPFCGVAFAGGATEWWSPGDGRPLPAFVEYTNPAGKVGILNTSGAVATKGHPFFEPLGINGRPRSANQERLRVRLTSVVSDSREIANVVQVRVTDHARFEAHLRLQIEATRQGAGIEGQAVVQDKGAGSMLGCLAAVAANNAQVHLRHTSLQISHWPRKRV
jgi:hypothetical protein